MGEVLALYSSACVCAHTRGSAGSDQGCSALLRLLLSTFSSLFLPLLRQELLGFSCVRPLRTVAAFLEEYGAGALLEDPLLEIATAGAGSLSFLQTSCLILRADWFCLGFAAELFQIGVFFGVCRRALPDRAQLNFSSGVAPFPSWIWDVCCAERLVAKGSVRATSLPTRLSVSADAAGRHATH